MAISKFESTHATRRLTFALLAILATPSCAYQAIAHRGVFHDRNDNYRLAENSVDALSRANSFGLAGAELDLRLTSDGVVVVTHDVVSNRATLEDNYSGRLVSRLSTLACSLCKTDIFKESR